MPNLNLLTQQAVDATMYLGDTALKRYGDHVDMSFQTQADRDRYVHRTNETAKDFQAYSQLLNGATGAFSLKQQHDMIAGLSESVRAAFDSVIPNLSTLIRSKVESGTTDRAITTARDVATIQKYLAKDKDIQAAFAPVHKAAGGTGVSDKTMESLLGMLTARAMPAYKTEEFSRRRYGKGISENNRGLSGESPEEFLPKSYRDSFIARRFQPRAISKAKGKEMISQAGLDLIAE